MPRHKQQRKGRRRRQRRRGPLKVQEVDENLVYTKPPRNSILRFNGFGFPNQYFCKLSYTETHPISAVQTYRRLFRGNSAYDPEWAAGGHQPMYFDELAAVYNRYTVYASAITCTVLNRSASGEAPFTHIALTPKNTDTFALDIDDEIETPRCKSTVMGPNTGGHGVATLRHYAKSTTMLGKPSDESGDDVLSATVTSSPSLQWYWHFTSTSMDGLTDINQYLKVKIVYFVRFYRMLPVAGS